MKDEEERGCTDFLFHPSSFLLHPNNERGQVTETVLRRSAAGEHGPSCIPRAVVRFGRPAPVWFDQSESRLSPHTGEGRPLVNGPGTKCEVGNRPPLVFLRLWDCGHI